MADLSDLQPAGVNLSRPLVGDDTGPAFIDADTVGSFARLYQAGTLRFPPELTQQVLDASLDAADLVELTALFGRECATAVAAGAPSVLLLRTLALYRALRTVAEQYLAGQTALGGVSIPNPVQLLIAREALEDHLQDLAARTDLPVPAALAIAMVSPGQLAELTGITENQWGVWRNRGVGPRFVKPTARTVRYVLGDVTDWIVRILPADQASA